MFDLIPMQTLQDFANTQIAAMSSVAKGFFTAIVVVFFGLIVIRSRFAISAIAGAIIACALFIWIVDYNGLSTIAGMFRDQSKAS